MKKTWRNGDVVIRISDIVAVTIPEDNAKMVTVYTKHPKATFSFRFTTAKTAEALLDEFEKIIEDSPV